MRFVCSVRFMAVVAVVGLVWLFGPAETGSITGERTVPENNPAGTEASPIEPENFAGVDAMKRREFIQKAIALGLTAGTAGWQRLLAAPIPPAEVRGNVVVENRPLAGVRVSDGCRVVATDASGEFSIQVGPDSGPYLFVTTPTGYWTDQFYLPTASAVAQRPVFRLKPSGEQDAYTAIYLTDVHLGEGRADQSYARFQATLDEINQLDPLPAFCWVGGDISLQGGQGTRYVELTSRLKVPVRNAVGNHEMLVRETDPRRQFGQLFGPTYYSFDVGRVHYVTLDGCQVNHEAERYGNVAGLLSSRELRWLADDLRLVPDGMATVVSIHIPLVSDYPERRGTTAAKAPHWIIHNADQVIDVLARHGVPLVLQGHLHENQRIVRKGVEFVESISVCGRWWKAPEGTRENGVSGEPRGFRLLDVTGSTVRHRYQSTAESRVEEVGEIVGRPERLTASEPAVLAVNIFDAAPGTVVSGSFAGDDFRQLSRWTEAGNYANLVPAHHWKWAIPEARLTPGRHVLRVRAEAPDGPAQSFEHVVTV
jgi:UDP-2,3-diacylglucosamine pyrophosphatase LpxH